mmetsp:Transcript_22815/g.28256  ORF Transcript_22815/g.28256 Transcript_22815/m.28256 type:complete len:149 (+) Transcript_22815:1296-1742(+)
MSYRGYLKGLDVLAAVCASYKHPPSVCHANLDDQFVLPERVPPSLRGHLTEERLREIEDRLKTNPGEKSENYAALFAKLKRLVLVLTICVGVVCECCFWVWYRRRKQRQVAERMRSQVSQAVAHYMQLDNSASMDESIEEDHHSEEAV